MALLLFCLLFVIRRGRTPARARKNRMASHHPSPATSTLTTGHRVGSAAVPRRLSTNPRRCFLSSARKPAAGGSPTAGADTEAPSSRSENAVLKAAWYGSELLGIAASLFRPPPSSPEEGSDADAEGGAVGSLDHAGVVEAIKDDFARSYFVTGMENLSDELTDDHSLVALTNHLFLCFRWFRRESDAESLRGGLRVC